tara:strand:- start:1268 stop:1504 length:237 start_codon:yes stop_codon:yes gene_type:complete
MKKQPEKVDILLRIIDIPLNNPATFILGTAIAGLGLVIGGFVADLAILTTIGGILLGLTVGGIAIIYAALRLCMAFWR